MRLLLTKLRESTRRFSRVGTDDCVDMWLKIEQIISDIDLHVFMCHRYLKDPNIT